MGRPRPAWSALAAAIATTALVLPVNAAADSVATTGPATSLTSTSAVLNGTASPNAPQSFYYFDYGTTQSYGHKTPQTPLSGNPDQKVSAKVTGLLPGTTYHYRLVVGSDYTPNLAKHDGQDRTFTTPATPGTIATTGQASSITANSAELNGVAQTTAPNATWYFQYGHTKSYGQTTKPQQIAQTGFTLVSAKVTGLRAHTTYHFRLVVVQGTPNYGADMTFITRHAGGHATLSSHRLKVRHGRASITFRCAGQAGDPCKAHVSLQTRTKVGKHFKTVGCGKGKLNTSAPHRSTLHVSIGRRCRALVKKAHKHRLRATLRAVFSTHQRRLRTGVRLVG